MFMKLIFFIVSFFLFFLFPHSLVGNETSFLVQENNTVLEKQGDVTKRYAAYSSLKIAISVIGFNEGILYDETHPLIDYDKSDQNHFFWLIPFFQNSYNPRTWMSHKHSNNTFNSIWYSERILKQLSYERLQEYLAAFQYGDVETLKFSDKEGEPMFFWFKRNLKISTEEQVLFLQKLVASQLPASRRAQEITRKILLIDELSNGWKLYGKYCIGPHDSFLGPHGAWFVGWIEKGERHIIFAYHSDDSKNALIQTGIFAKGIVKEKLKMMIFSMK